MKVLAVALVLSSSLYAVFADYRIDFFNDAGTEGYLDSPCAKRVCQCLSGTQTNKIKNTSGGLVRVFSTTDCTGSYETIAAGSTISNAQWVDSVSFGPSGTSYVVGNCGNVFNGEVANCP
jgi:hypothetical protein